MVPDPEYSIEENNANSPGSQDAAMNLCSEHTIADERTIASLISNVPGMIYRCNDEKGTMEYVSDGCLFITGYRPSDLMGRMITYKDLIHPDDRELVLSGVQNAIRKDQKFNFIYRILDAKGREKWVCDQGSYSLMKNGGPIVRDGFIMDITDRIESERKLEKAWKQADLYVDLMGHDVNNMNQVALGFLELALEKMEQNGRLDVTDMVLLEKPFEALKSNSHLVDNVRKVRRERSGEIEPILIDLGKMLEEVKRQFTNINSRDVSITYLPANGCHVMANELLLDVFLNLVGNAIKHSSGPLSIDLKLESEQRHEGKFYRVSVEDNGPGIPDDRKKTLIEQACLKRARRKGNGFGLCLVRTLLEDFNGSIWVENRVPFDHTQGSRFVVLLPAAEK